MSRPSEYTPDDYDAMFADPERTNAYLSAITKVVRPGDVVVEIGTGVGYFAVAACRAGARVVYAIESEPSIVLANHVIRENGCDDRVRCIAGDANRITLPERGNVLLSDLRGVLPMRADGIPTLVNARERMLVPGARLIPERDIIHAAPCAAPARWDEVELTLGAEPHGIRRSALAARARSSLHRMRVDADMLCAQPAMVAPVDYRSITSPHMDATVSWTVERDARIEGIALWFDAHLADGISFTTSPLAARTMYSHAFLPLEAPFDAIAQDRIETRLRFRLVEGSYVISWDTTIRPGGPGRAEVTMRQSTLGSALIAPETLPSRRADYRPEPASISIMGELLALIDGEHTLAEIAQRLDEAHPGRFRDEAAALRWVTLRVAQLAEGAAE